MVKKKARAKVKRPKVSQKKAAKKVAKKRGVVRLAKKAAKKKIARKGAKKATRKFVAKKTVKKTAAKKVVRKAAPKKIARAPVKPKPPRRTRQMPPPRPAAPLPIEVKPVAPAMPAATMPAPSAPPTIEAQTVDVAAPPPRPAVDVGSLAPDFELPDETGKTHKLSAYRGKKVVLYFYPKDDTPGCTTEACGFRDTLGQFDARNGVVLGVSPDSVASHQRFSQKFNLTFPLLADEGHKVADRYGVWVEKERYGETYMGIARTTFIVDADGRVAHVLCNVRPEEHEQEVLRYLGT